MASSAVLTFVVAVVASYGCAAGGEGLVENPGSDATIDSTRTDEGVDAPAIDSTTTDTLGEAPVDTGVPISNGTLGELWVGKARWSLQRMLTLDSTKWPYGYGAGAHVEVVDGTWYLFSRKVNFTDKPAYCAGLTDITFGTEVRASTDEGKTWSDAVGILTPSAGSAWECAATDGDAWYDAAKSEWHYLFQCLARSGGWSGCHAMRSGKDPRGAFAAKHANPVIHGGDLWNRICTDPSAVCVTIPGAPKKVFDEGTFDIVHHDGTNYWITFHGFDGSRGYRGFAKTPDFVTYVAGDPAKGTPRDAIYSRNDAAGWRESWASGGTIGGGAARILEEGGLWYMLIESGDVSLGCIAGQNWDLGLLRAKSPSDVKWDQLPAGNPVAYSSKLPERDGKPLPCNPAYGNLFRDGKTSATWMHYTRETDDPKYAGMYFYRLEKSANLLKNADLWKCAVDDWTRFPVGPTNLVVYRFPNGATDGNCYLATNCGAASCVAGQSVYQDVALVGLAGSTLRYGAKFLAEGGDAGATLTVHELDAASAIVASHSVPIALSGAWSATSASFVVDPKSVTARYQLYLDKPATLRMDEAFLAP